MACKSAHNPRQDTTQVAPAVAQTDDNGTTSFDVNGWTFGFSVHDRYTSQPVSGVGILLFADGPSADYFVLDPQNRYYPFFGGATGVQSSQLIAQATHAQDQTPNPGIGNSNISLTLPTPPLCGISTGIRIDPGLFNLILQSPFFTVEKTGVTVSDLNFTLGQLADLAARQAEGTVAQKGVVMALPRLGLAKAAAEAIGHELDAVGWVLLGITACADAQLDAYGNYYHSLCYDDSETFTIYGLTGFTQLQNLFNSIPLVNLLVGFDSPTFVVVPEPSDTTSPDSIPPYAVVNAATYEVTPDAGAVLSPYDFDVTMVNGKLPSFRADNDENTPENNTDSVEIVLNACSNYNPTYVISAPSGSSKASHKIEVATTAPFTVKDKDDYALAFYLQSSDRFATTCPNGYQTSTGPSKPNENGGTHHSLTVACSASTDGGVSDAGAADADPFSNCSVIATGVTWVGEYGGKIGYGTSSGQYLFDSGTITKINNKCSQYGIIVGNGGMICASEGAISANSVTSLETVTGKSYPPPSILKDKCSANTTANGGSAVLWDETFVFNCLDTQVSLYVSNLASGEMTLVAGVPTAGSFSLYGNGLAYTDKNDGRMKLYDISTGQTYDTGYSSYYPLISGMKILFSNVKPATEALTLIDMSKPSQPKATEIAVVSNNPGFYSPNLYAISGNLVAYQSIEGDTMIYDIATKQAKTVYHLTGSKPTDVHDIQVNGKSATMQVDGENVLLLESGTLSSCSLF